MISTILTPAIRGRLHYAEPMSKHTTWRAGGPADQFYAPADIDDLAAFLRSLDPKPPVYWLGLGSNLLVRDGGVRGVVIAVAGILNGISIVSPGCVRAEAGVPGAKLARFSVRQGLTGVEFLAGIPGTIGGALAMNAGAFGGETWEQVQKVETIDRAGRIRTRAREDFKIGYRSVEGPANEWFIAGHFKLAQGPSSAGKSLIKTLLAKRGASQPTQLPNAGSVFRNPPEDYAARLIETAGLKGLCEGQACVSELHANFIVNQGNATAAQIEALIEKIQIQVQQRHGIKLQTEVRIIGDAL